MEMLGWVGVTGGEADHSWPISWRQLVDTCQIKTAVWSVVMHMYTHTQPSERERQGPYKTIEDITQY